MTKHLYNILRYMLYYISYGYSKPILGLIRLELVYIKMRLGIRPSKKQAKRNAIKLNELINKLEEQQ